MFTKSWEAAYAAAKGFVCGLAIVIFCVLKVVGQEL
jgi:hypothetical protein